MVNGSRNLSFFCQEWNFVKYLYEFGHTRVQCHSYEERSIVGKKKNDHIAMVIGGQKSLVAESDLRIPIWEEIMDGTDKRN